MQSVGSAALGRHSPATLLKINRAFQLRLRGWTYSRIAEELHLSRQRIQQLVSPAPSVQFAIASHARGLCEKCGVFVGFRGHIHHRLTFGNSVDSFSDVNNLQLLCVSCHRKAHGLKVKVVNSMIGRELRRRGIRMKDIAELVGLNPSDVSAWLNHRAGVSKTRKIEEAVSKLLEQDIEEMK